MYVLRDAKGALAWRLVVDRSDRPRRQPGVRGTSFGRTLADEPYPFGRVTPLPGGVPAWKREASDSPGGPNRLVARRNHEATAGRGKRAPTR
jgi:hypothetical protein